MSKYSRNVKDAELIETKALPNGAAAVNSGSIDLEFVKTNGLFLAECELEVVAPALVVADLPDTKTMIYKVEDSADDSTFATLYDAVITQTGAGGAGDATETVRVKLPEDVSRYVRVTATNSGAGDASDKSLTMQLVF